MNKLFRLLSFFLLTFSLYACTASMHPEYKKMVKKNDVPLVQLNNINNQFQLSGLQGAYVSADPQGKVRLLGNYDSEGSVKKAFEIAINQVGIENVNLTTPTNIKRRDWELELEKGLESYISQLANKYNIAVVSDSIQIKNSGDNSKTNFGLIAEIFEDDGNGKVQFKAGEYSPTPQAKSFYTELARSILRDGGAKKAKRKILFVGHTDDTGDSKLNAELSEKRAREIAKIFQAVGLESGNLYYQGAGETIPMFDNATKDGQTKNRRVEIVFLNDDEKFDSYLSLRKPNYSLYRPHKVSNNTASIKKPKTNILDKNSQSNSKEPSKIDSSFLDFGGNLYTSNKYVDIGALVDKQEKYKFINEAIADDSQILSCNIDRPRISGAVKSIGNDKAYATKDFMPGLYDTSWAGYANGHLVAITHVGVLRNNGGIVRKPDLLLYKDYDGGKNVKAFYKTSPDVNIYRGSNALLYRIFDNGPLKCIDLVVPNKTPNKSEKTEIFYNKGSNLYSRVISVEIAKNNN